MSDDTEISEKLKCKICMDCIDKRAIKCGDPKCSVYFHKRCFDLVAKVFVIDPKNWRCRGCAYESKGRKASRSVSCSEPSSEQVTILKKEIDCLVREKELISSIASEREYIVDVQKKIIANLENKTVNICSCSKNTDSPGEQKTGIPISYSQAVKTVKHPYLLIKAADGKSSNRNVEAEFKSKYTPGSLNVDIAKARLTRNGFLISCTNTADLKILKETLQSDTSSNFSICEPAKLNPRLIIYDVPKKCVSHKPQSNNPVLVDSFIETLISDNCLKATTADFKIVSVLNNKEFFNIIIEISPFLFKPLVDKGYVFINWTRCRLQEHVNIVRCFKCSKYGHYKKDCRNNDMICPRCSDAHEAKDCKNQNVCCPNCKMHNIKFKTNWPTDHSATSKSCNFYVMKIQNLRNSIAYE
nr:unnamed protein product [Callosobruchus analis]